jgi:hypothetical protein
MTQYESTTDPTALYVSPQGWGEWHAAVGADIDVAEVLGAGKVAREVQVMTGGLLSVQFYVNGSLTGIRSIPVGSGGRLYGVAKILASGSTAFGLALWE